MTSSRRTKAAADTPAAVPATPEITHDIEVWTPKMAEAALAKNTVNRPVRGGKVDQYARDMTAKKWNWSDPIVFDTEGNLIQGQHRMHAQIKSGETITWMIVRNVDPSAQKTMDTGIIRSVSDQLHFMGETASQLMAAVLRIVHHIDKGTINAARYTVSNEEILSTLDKHPEVRHSTQIAMSSRGGMTPISPSVLGAAHWMISRVNGTAEADAFLHRIITLTSESEGSPVLALARRANEIKRNQMRVNYRDYLALVIKAWNYDAANKTVNKLNLYSKTGEFVLPAVDKRAIPLVDQDEDAEEEVS